MREIKFRGITIATNTFIYGSLFWSEKEDKYYICGETKDYGFQKMEVDRKTIGQFTNLPDKTNKEIYEGDIVSKEYNEQYPIQKKEVKTDMMGNDVIVPVTIGYDHIKGRTLFEIEFWNNRWRGKHIKHEPDEIGQTYGWGDFHVSNDCEVIGNKFENEDLL